MIIPRDQLSQVVDERRRIDPEWYTWITEMTQEINKLRKEVDDLTLLSTTLEARITALGG